MLAISDVSDTAAKPPIANVRIGSPQLFTPSKPITTAALPSTFVAVPDSAIVCQLESLVSVIDISLNCSPLNPYNAPSTVLVEE